MYVMNDTCMPACMHVCALTFLPSYIYPQLFLLRPRSPCGFRKLQSCVQTYKQGNGLFKNNPMYSSLNSYCIAYWSAAYIAKSQRENCGARDAIGARRVSRAPISFAESNPFETFPIENYYPRCNIFARQCIPQTNDFATFPTENSHSRGSILARQCLSQTNAFATFPMENSNPRGDILECRCV